MYFLCSLDHNLVSSDDSFGSATQNFRHSWTRLQRFLRSPAVIPAWRSQQPPNASYGFPAFTQAKPVLTIHSQ
ncbi:hypothetical protein E2C01_044185 [Portunus trituberculatus]|uniref:Uncharacterized protein n=1 Tax=Portunus trituberculatus TaxID=210409 RepID=A0A5B7FY55_PORTR|nr:hypothetical protein [Portunus trituberculatus]